MTRIDALVLLLLDSRSDRTSNASLKRVLKACKALELTQDETNTVLHYLCYARSDGSLLPAFVKDNKP